MKTLSTDSTGKLFSSGDAEEISFFSDSIPMGLEILLQTESGGQIDSVADATNFLGKLLPQIDDASYPILAEIDPYGDTVFDGSQMRRFLVEWKDVSSRAVTAEERELVSKIEELALRCCDQGDSYVRFIGS